MFKLRKKNIKTMYAITTLIYVKMHTLCSTFQHIIIR